MDKPKHPTYDQLKSINIDGQSCYFYDNDIYYQKKFKWNKWNLLSNNVVMAVYIKGGHKNVNLHFDRMTLEQLIKFAESKNCIVTIFADWYPPIIGTCLKMDSVSYKIYSTRLGLLINSSDDIIESSK